MNTVLLRLIRNARPRLDAATGQKAMAKQKRTLMQTVLCSGPLSRIPLSLSSEIRFLLPARPKPNSKAETVVRELVAKGVRRSSIWTPELSLTGRLRRMTRLAVRLPWAAVVGARLSRRAPHLRETDIGLIIGRQAFAILLLKYPAVRAIVISDLSPERHMLWSAAAAHGRALWWQDDFHHNDPLCYGIESAAVLNQQGYERVREASTSAQIMRRPTIRIRPLRAIPVEPRLGICTNAKFAATPEQWDIISRVRARIGARVAYLRLHPNSRLSRNDVPEHWIKIAPPDESLSSFSERIDVALVGNSSVQLKLLCEGVPVIHMAGLDIHGFDQHGYHRHGLTYAVQSTSDLNLTTVSAHYSDSSIQLKIADYLRISASVEPDPQFLRS